MRYQLLLVLLTIISLSYNCKSQKNTQQSLSGNTDNPKMVIIDKNLDMMTIKKDFTIKEATLKDSLITIKIKYIGCSDDTWDMVFDGNIMKSFPPKATLVLIKKSGSQNCEKKMEKQLQFIISPVKYAEAKTLIIQFPGFEPKLLYNY